jgi:hypothetical protein
VLLLMSESTTDHTLHELPPTNGVLLLCHLAVTVVHPAANLGHGDFTSSSSIRHDAITEIRISVNLNQPVLQEVDRMHQCLDLTHVIAEKDV